MDSAALLDLLGNENRRRILRLLARKPCYVTEISEYLGVSPKAVIDHLRKLEEAGLVESRTDENRRKYFHIARNLRLEVNVSPYEFGTKSAYAASPNLDIATCRYVSIDAAVRATAEEARAAAEASGVEDPGDATDGDATGGAEPALESADGGVVDDAEAAVAGDGDGSVASDGDAGVAGDGDGGFEETAADGADAAAVEQPRDAAPGEEGLGDLAAELDRLQDVEHELSLAQRWVQGRITEVLDRLSETFASDADARLYTELLAALAGGRRSVEELSARVDAPRAVVEDALASLSERDVVEKREGDWVIAD